jgi:hypothetical protein
MKFRFVAKILLAGLAIMACARPALSSEVRGQLAWPEEWVVFAPFTRDDPALTADQLTGIPGQITKAAGGIVKPRRVNVPRGERLDLKDCFEEQRVGNVAWVFTTLHSDAAQTATIGMGADWWFTAWLNGKEILATPEAGNSAWPPSPNDFTADVPLLAGDNILAVRVVTGRSSSLFAAGGPAEIRAARGKLGGADDPMRFNRPTPFMERMAFGLEDQAYATAEMPFEFTGAEADLRAGALVGLQKLPKRQMRLVEYYGKPEVHDIEYRQFPFEPVKLRLSKSKYSAEDLHLDVLLWTTPPEDVPHTGTLDIILKDAQCKELARHMIRNISDTGWFFSLGLPPALNGRTGQVEAVWKQDGREIGRASAAFSVLPPAKVAQSGRIPIRILNEPDATIKNAPMTVGVPFPQGALYDAAHVRLVDEQGRDIPLQTRITGRWSRYGAIKWLLCDFTADVAGKPRTLYLEYGDRWPDILKRFFGWKQPDNATIIAVTERAAGFPVINAGRLRVDESGVAFDFKGNGAFQPVLKPEALYGAFVEHEDGRRFAVPTNIRHAIEEIGPEKIVVRRTGWYSAVTAAPPTHAHANSHAYASDRFCNFITRFVFHRDSPVIRIYHTWIFTGDGNKDRIRAMGWRFDAAGSIQPDGFLTAFTNGTWAPGDRLVQFDYHTYKIDNGATSLEGRTPGVLSAAIGGARLLFGAKDFWQNFPGELEFTTNAFTFYNWPRHNQPAAYERPVPIGQAYRLRFAHEGALLDFKLPQEYTEDPIWTTASKKGVEVNWEKGRPESVNAQGIARTEEFLIYLTDPAVSREASARVMQGLNDESLRAVADPAWMCASGAFGPIHQQDKGKYPLAERTYEELCHAPWRWNERLDFYGKWLYGDLPANSMDPRTRSVSVDRTLKKNHHGWPFNWHPYARSGDARMLKYAEAATRQMIDANFCHYATPDMEEENSRFKRRQGWWVTLLFPWAGGGAYGAQNIPELRGICIDSDYLWYNYHLTGFQRPRDVVRLWGAAVQLDTSRILPGRISTSNMRSYLDMYKATFDPSFWPYLVPENLRRWQGYFDEMENLCAGQSAALANVQRLRRNLDFAALFRWLDAAKAYPDYFKDYTVLSARIRAVNAAKPEGLAHVPRPVGERTVSILESAIRGGGEKPLPPEFDGIDRQRVRTFMPEMEGNDKNANGFFNDDESAFGYAPSVHTPDVPFTFGFYQSDTRIDFLRRVIKNEEITPGKYRLYKLGTITLSKKSQIWFSVKSWSTKVVLDDLWEPGDPNEWDAWASIKFHGPAYGGTPVKGLRSGEENLVLVDRVILVKK